ncbi:hemolysin family protein [Senegalia massiliensis]|uniref:HlyC/CorC family transporter n=1 Tax=Senegalia massiliensis TaxID=1720316 RepID=A0A845QX35_9CLOT|nr:hemolysin family protein [Senegalia massiliensis]NBI06076.1 HlyC/CorC family transporter [Senegalia massiliensis]
MDFILILILILLNGFFAAAEFALVSIEREKYESEKYNTSKKVQSLLKITENPSRFLATIQVGITLAGFLASASAAVTISKPFGEILEATGLPVISDFSDQIAIVIGTIILSFITLVFGELVPKRIALANTERTALFSVTPINLLSKIMKPVIFILTKTTDIVAKLLGTDTEGAEEKITEEEIRNTIRKGRRHGVLNPTETEMLERIFEFDDKLVKDIKTAKNKIFSVNIETDIKGMMDGIIKSGFSRIPVRDKSDDIIGILYIKDLFYEMERIKKQEIEIKNILRKPYFVPETKKIDTLYKELKVNQNHMAIIIDEYGSISGIVTLEDILEEIVGEIFDEFEQEIHSIKYLEEGVYLVDGLESIKKVNEELELDLPLDGPDTIGGFVLSLLDDIPDKDDYPMINFNNIIFKVEKIKGKRIKVVKMTITK